MKHLATIGSMTLLLFSLGCPDETSGVTDVHDSHDTPVFHVLSGIVYSRSGMDTTYLTLASVTLDTHRVVMTDATGRFRIDSVAPGYHSLSVAADRHTVFNTYMTMISDTSWTVELTPIYTVAGVAFGTFQGDTLWADSATLRIDRRLEATSDLFGRFAVPGVEAGSHTLEIIHPFFDSPSYDILVDSTLSIALQMPVASGLSDIFPLQQGAAMTFEYTYAYTEHTFPELRFTGEVRWTIIQIETINGERQATIGKHARGRLIYGHSVGMSLPHTFDTLSVDQPAGEFVVRQTAQHDLRITSVTSPADTLPINFQDVINFFSVRKYVVISSTSDTVSFKQELAYNDAAFNAVPGVGPTYVYRLVGNHLRYTYTAHRID